MVVVVVVVVSMSGFPFSILRFHFEIQEWNGEVYFGGDPV